MADIIGVLGEASTLTAGVTTIYTCPASKAAKVRIMYSGQAAADGTTDLTVTVNGIAVMVQANIAASNFMHSSKGGFYDVNAAAPTGVDDDTTVAPHPIEYFLSAGDTITYTIGGTAMIAFNAQVVGSEIDIT